MKNNSYRYKAINNEMLNFFYHEKNLLSLLK